MTKLLLLVALIIVVVKFKPIFLRLYKTIRFNEFEIEEEVSKVDKEIEKKELKNKKK